jgi:endoribonuclease Dicer
MGQNDLLIKLEDVNSAPGSHNFDPHQNLADLVTTPSTHAAKLVSDNSDTDDDAAASDLPPSVLTNAQRKRAQNAAFEDFVREKDEALLQERSQKAGSLGALEDGISLNDSGSARRIIDKVRDYQSELFARAKAGNIIAVLDTGSGKTLIAALLLRDIVTKEMEHRASGKAPRTSFFLTNSVALAEQQHQMLCDNLATMPAVVHGRKLDTWRRQEWSELFNAHEVVVCTAEVLYQCLNHAYITIENINLIVVDEAHHAKKEHPYAR